MRTNSKKFWKIDSTENDFVLLHEDPTIFKGPSIPEICAPHSGVGADGVIFVWKSAQSWNWRFFNSDGSETGVCGNAARAMGLWLLDEMTEKSPAQWTGKIGSFEARRNPSGLIEVTWPVVAKPLKLPDELVDMLTGFNDHGLASIQRFDVGVPHLVLVNHEVWNFEQRVRINPILRNFVELGPEGANVTWYSNKTGETVTYERGVERETRACGSGALAAFLAFQQFQKDNGHPEIPQERTFQFPGGPLTVSLNQGRLWLSGPVRRVFSGEFNS